MRKRTRRGALQAGGIALLGSLAGCSLPTSGADDPEDPSYDRLDGTAVAVLGDVDLSMPQEVGTVETPEEADLLVVPGDTGTSADRAVEWFGAGLTLALLGAEAEATWLSWARSDAFDRAFENRGFSDSEPDPRLVVAATVGEYVKTYRYTWADGPRDRDVLRAIDEALVAAANETPPG